MVQLSLSPKGTNGQVTLGTFTLFILEKTRSNNDP